MRPADMAKPNRSDLSRVIREVIPTAPEGFSDDQLIQVVTEALQSATPLEAQTLLALSARDDPNDTVSAICHDAALQPVMRRMLSDDLEYLAAEHRSPAVRKAAAAHPSCPAAV